MFSIFWRVKCARSVCFLMGHVEQVTIPKTTPTPSLHLAHTTQSPSCLCLLRQLPVLLLEQLSTGHHLCSSRWLLNMENESYTKKTRERDKLLNFKIPIISNPNSRLIDFSLSRKFHGLLQSRQLCKGCCNTFHIWTLSLLWLSKDSGNPSLVAFTLNSYKKDNL